MPRKRPGRPQSLDVVAELARRQHGVVEVGQLYSLGVSDRQLRRLEAAGFLHRLHQGVYGLGYRPLTRRGEWTAALLAMGEGAVLSHRSAAALPVTSPSRTLLDLAPSLPLRHLERAIDEAARLWLCQAEDLKAVSRSARRPGSRQLRALLSRHAPGSTPTRSELEERFLALYRKHRLPQPEVNVPLLDYVVDFLWRAAGLIVEHASHGTRRAFQADRDRDGRLTVAGYRVLRFTWWDVTRRPAVVTDRIRRLLSEGRG